jgi:hypothetical protein
MPWLVMLMPYFGQWPEWTDLFLVSCAANKNVHWRFFTDCDPPGNRPANVEFRTMSVGAFTNAVSERLGFSFAHADPHKVSEVRPALGLLHEQEIADFEFFGYGDLDVVWGDIDGFYNPLRAAYDMISTHSNIVAGHFSVFRNTHDMRRAFLETPGYPDLLQLPRKTGFDEWNFAKVFKDKPRCLFREQFSTVLSPRGWHDGTHDYPHEWYWRDGHLTNIRDGEREFLYLHFMRWKSLRYAPPTPAPTEGAWLSLDRLVWVDWRDAERDGFSIGPYGFRPIAKSAARPDMDGL